MRCKTRPIQRAGTGNAGMVLVAALLVMALLSVLCVAGISSSSLEVKISGHDRDAKQSFYLCEAGLEKVKYEVYKGWGKGTGGGTFPSFSFQFDAATMPDPVKSGGSIGWGTVSDKWQNFTLVDPRGFQYTIQANNTSYGITQCQGPAEAPMDGRASLFFADDANAFSGNGVAGAGQMLVAGTPWAGGEWSGYVLRDSAAAQFLVTGNTNNTLFLTGTPADGAFTILRAVGADLGTPGTYRFTFYVDPDTANRPGAPNSLWLTNGYTFGNGLWYLRDSQGRMYRITATVYSTSPERMELTVATDGTPVQPAHGAFQITTNPWLVDPPAVAQRTYGATTFPTPSGTDYGSVTVSATPSSGTPGAFTLSATSSSAVTGDAKTIRVDATLLAGGGVQLANWRYLE